MSAIKNRFNTFGRKSLKRDENSQDTGSQRMTNGDNQVNDPMNQLQAVQGTNGRPFLKLRRQVLILCDGSCTCPECCRRLAVEHGIAPINNGAVASSANSARPVSSEGIDSNEASADNGGLVANTAALPNTGAPANTDTPANAQASINSQAPGLTERPVSENHTVNSNSAADTSQGLRPNNRTTVLKNKISNQVNRLSRALGRTSGSCEEVPPTGSTTVNENDPQAGPFDGFSSVSLAQGQGSSNQAPQLPPVNANSGVIYGHPPGGYQAPPPDQTSGQATSETERTVIQANPPNYHTSTGTTSTRDGELSSNGSGSINTAAMQSMTRYAGAATSEAATKHHEGRSNDGTNPNMSIKPTNTNSPGGTATVPGQTNGAQTSGGQTNGGHTNGGQTNGGSNHMKNGNLSANFGPGRRRAQT